MTHTSAHDALSDVEATIQVAKLIKEKQPKLFDYSLLLRKKAHVKSLLNWQIMKPIVHVSNKIPADRGCLAIMLPLAIHPTNPNGVICYDLAFDPSDLFALDVEDIRDRIFTPQNELPEDCPRIALKTIHINKSPFVSPLSVLKDVDLARIKLDYAANKAHLEKFKSAESLIQKVQAVFDQAFDNDSDDVDSMLYSGFFSPQDKNNFDAIRKLSIEGIKSTEFNFKDKRADILVSRYIARNFPESLSVSENTLWKADVKARINLRYDVDAKLLIDKLNLLRSQANSAEHLRILDLVYEDTQNKLLKIS